MSVRGPAPANDIYGVSFPSYGSDSIGGIGGPGLPGMAWDPSGDDTPLGQVYRFVRGGIPESSHGHVTLKSFDFVSQQYMLPPLSDGTSERIKRGMPTFAVREFDKEDGSTIIAPHFVLNQWSRDQWQDFVRVTSINSPYQDQEKLQFLNLMRKYGDNVLVSFAREKRNNGESGLYKSNSQSYQELSDFLRLSEQDGYCYLTKHGWTNHVNYHGAAINTNIGAGLETMDHTEAELHYVQANIGLAKRIQMGQCFGTSQEVTMGSRLWIELRRERCPYGGYGAFQLYPGASNRETHPSNNYYVDERGCQVQGILYNVGTVLEPANSSPQQGLLEAANNNREMGSSIENAQEMFALLPTFYVNMGFSQ